MPSSQPQHAVTSMCPNLSWQKHIISIRVLSASVQRTVFRPSVLSVACSPTTQLVKVHLWGEQQMQGPVYMVLQEDIIPFVILGHMQQLPLVTRCLHEKKQGSKTAKQISMYHTLGSMLPCMLHHYQQRACHQCCVHWCACMWSCFAKTTQQKRP